MAAFRWLRCCSYAAIPRWRPSHAHDRIPIHKSLDGVHITFYRLFLPIIVLYAPCNWRAKLAFEMPSPLSIEQQHITRQMWYVNAACRPRHMHNLYIGKWSPLSWRVPTLKATNMKDGRRVARCSDIGSRHIQQLISKPRAEHFYYYVDHHHGVISFCPSQRCCHMAKQYRRKGVASTASVGC